MRASAFIHLQNVLIGLTICGLPLYLLFAGVAAYERAPPNTFSPFCTYIRTYRLSVTIETEGKLYSSFVVRQRLKPREWIAQLGGCYEILDDRFHETGIDGTGSKLVDSSFETERGVVLWQDGGRRSSWR